MSQSKVHSQGNVPFKWEKQPGICKVTQREYPSETQRFKLELPPPLPPPPSVLTEKARTPLHDKQIPLPPCTFMPPSRSHCSSKRGLWKQEDPFLAAFKECTKSTRKGKPRGKDHIGFGMRNSFSCKHSCNVRDDSIVRMSPIPLRREDGERERGELMSNGSVRA